MVEQQGLMPGAIRGVGDEFLGMRQRFAKDLLGFVEPPGPHQEPAQVQAPVGQTHPIVRRVREIGHDFAGTVRDALAQQLLGFLAMVS